MFIAEHIVCSRPNRSTPYGRIPCRVALIDAKGKIVAVDEDWISLAKETGTPLKHIGPGANYLDVCRDGSSSASRNALHGINEILEGKSPAFVMDYSCHLPSRSVHFRMTAARITCKNARVSITHTDITDLHQSRAEGKQDFARRLINAQEEERQRIAREIHDDLGNHVALMSLSVRHAIKQVSMGHGDSIQNELGRVLDGILDLSSALRNLSHSLHPAPLRYVGIRGALKSLQDAFQKTSGIQMHLFISPEIRRFTNDVELCLFRITQECLQNVTKHSGADRVKVILEQTHKHIQLTVTDSGRGFTRSKDVGNGVFGVRGLEERAVGIGGRVTINSFPGSGTEVRVIVPLEKHSDAVTVESVHYV